MKEALIKTSLAGKVDFSKSANGLVPAIVQDAQTRKVLMLGYMDRDALERTEEEGRVTFFSRSKDRLWTKGEESGHFLLVENMSLDCDRDTLLIMARPMGPVCHTGADTCFDEENITDNFLIELENTIIDRKVNPRPGSYTARLFEKGINKIAQKVGEEAVELVIESKDDCEELFLNEAADLLYHYLVLLVAKGFVLEDVMDVLKKRHK
ncbi:bifunctional phosphoribosyl-AMP cyclohydrolase/phosphoribosyl-ATP diphosphatase HisIE [Compostibacter hankyongensis]|uniref:Histidine biosynthesis bifunctional protein HisIE n=1 Tax=Compostibacter hankyongensis TaxID=1007089 RepID=A0ABP8FXB7_9BACT